MTMSPTTDANKQQRLADEFADVDIHADGKEEYAEQQPLEGADGGFDRLAEFGLGQQQPRDECAQRHRKSGRGRGDAGADDHKQRRRHEQFMRGGGSDQPEQRSQQQAADDHDRRNGQRRIHAARTRYGSSPSCLNGCP